MVTAVCQVADPDALSQPFLMERRARLLSHLGQAHFRNRKRHFLLFLTSCLSYCGCRRTFLQVPANPDVVLPDTFIISRFEAGFWHQKSSAGSSRMAFLDRLMNIIAPIVRLSFLCFFFLMHSIAHAVEQPLLGEAMKWTGGAGEKSAVSILSQNPLVAEVKVGGGPEGFPGITLSAPSPRDLRMFSRVVFEVLLESKDPGVRSGGKSIVLCLNDNKFRHESIEGKPVKQQLSSFNVKEGEWQEVTIELTQMERSAVSSLQFYLYDMPYNYPHSYQVTFRNLRLIGTDPERTYFDGNSYLPRALAGSAEGNAGTIKTKDGLVLTLAPNGGILKVTTGESIVGEGKSQVSGILVRDAKTDKPPTMVGGHLQKSEDGLCQTAELPEMKLKVEANYRARQDRLLIEGRVESTAEEDRAITVYVAIPIGAGSSWTWHQDLNRSVRPFEEMKAVPAFESSMTTFPLAVLSDIQKRRGIALLLDQRHPVVYRLTVNPRERLLYAAFDFGLIKGKNVAGRDMRTADFRLEIAATDPMWGFRSGVEKLYAFHPENFVDRVGHGGGWEITGTGRQNSSLEERTAGGYRFDWSAVDIDRETWTWNAQHDVANLIYIEPDFFQFSLGDYKSPTTVDVQKRLDKLAADDEQEWAAFLPLHYSRSHVGGRHTGDRQLRPYLATLIASQRASIMSDRDGNPVLGLGHRPGWIGDSGFGSMSPANLAPAIPGGRGAWILEKHFKFYDEAVKAEGWAPLAGFGLDCFMDVPNDYRRENFQYLQSPLGYDPQTKQPMVARGFGSVEWLQEVRKRFEKNNIIIMSNCFGPMAFAAPDLDVFGLENSQVSEPQFYRVIAGPKRPITFLPYSPPSRAILDFHVFWGIYPGRNVPADVLKTMIPVLDTLYQATWQPVTGVRAPPGSVQLERYGKGDDDSIYVAVHNSGAEAASVELRLDTSCIGKRSRAQGIFNDSAAYSIEKNHFRVELGQMETKVLRLDR